MIALAKVLAVDASLLRRRPQYRLLFVAQTISLIGTMATSVALPFQIYALTGASLAVGALGLAELVPLLLLAIVGGAFADAYDRRFLAVVTEAALAVCAAILVIGALGRHPIVAVLYFVAAAMAALDALQRPALDAILPRVVDRDEIPAAAALGSMRSTMCMVAGPALGGILIANAGVAGAYALNALTLIVSVMLVARMRAVAPPDPSPPALGRILDGLRYARSRPDLLGTYLVDWVAMFFGMPNALFPALASAYGGAAVLGAFYAAPAAGAMVVAATSGWTKRVRHHGRAIVIAAAIWGVAVVALGVANTLPLALAALAFAGAADMVSGLFRSTIWNRSVPHELRGRLASLEYISYASGPTLGNVEAGVVAAVAGTRGSVIVGGVLCVAGVAAAAVALPALWRYVDENGRVT